MWVEGAGWFASDHFWLLKIALELLIFNPSKVYKTNSSIENLYVNNWELV
jgi:hypothetical protein